MPRRRTNDPLGMPRVPSFATDAQREAELLGEFGRRLQYAFGSYAFAKKAFPLAPDFNRDLKRLKEIATGKRLPSDRKRLHPDLELLINVHAQRHAEERTGDTAAELAEGDFAFGIRKTVQSTKPRRGRPDNWILRLHVEGIMALLQEAMGGPALVQLYKNSVYDPQPTNPLGKHLVELMGHVEPEVPSSAIIRIIHEARRKYARKPMRFLDFFPGYGGRIDPETMELKMRPGWKVERFEIARPIYCR